MRPTYLVPLLRVSLGLAMAGVSPLAVQAADPNPLPAVVPMESFCMALSARLFADINQNDGRAAVKTWTTVAVRDAGLALQPESLVLANAGDMIAGLTNGRVDAAVMPTDVFLAVQQQAEITDLFASESQAQGGEEYLLLVHRDSGITNLAGLRNRTLLLYDGPSGGLMEPWIDVTLADAGLPRHRKHFKTVASKSKLSSLVLPVFFRTANACIVTRRAFNTLVELNPQLGEQLVPLAASEQLVLVVGCFNARCPAEVRRRLLESIVHLDQTTVGQQVLTVFRSDRMARLPETTLTSARRLMDRYHHLPTPSGSSAARPILPVQP
jgi:ABC-type phosphate/phosphonate transport system substrate-binding protein